MFSLLLKELNFIFLFIFPFSLVQFGLLSGHILGNSCSLGSNLFSLYFVNLYLFISRFGFKSGICLFIAQVPVHCFSITFLKSGICLLIAPVPVHCFSVFLRRFYRAFTVIDCFLHT